MRGQIFVIDGTLVGFCLSHYSKAINKVYLENIFVDVDYRGCGFATLMVSKVLEIYGERNQGKMLRFVALVEELNTPAIST